MARIADEEVERLKREVSVQRLAEAKGVKLKKHGKDLMGLCPFHDDRNPSLVVTAPRTSKAGKRSEGPVVELRECPEGWAAAAGS